MLKKISEGMFILLTIVFCGLAGIIMSVFLGLLLRFSLEYFGFDTKAITVKEIMAWSAMW